MTNIMTSLWIQTKTESDFEYWYVDYIDCEVIKSEKRPKYQSIRKWNGTIESFLETKNLKYKKEKDNTFRFTE